MHSLLCTLDSVYCSGSADLDPRFILIIVATNCIFGCNHAMFEHLLARANTGRAHAKTGHRLLMSALIVLDCRPEALLHHFQSAAAATLAWGRLVNAIVT